MKRRFIKFVISTCIVLSIFSVFNFGTKVVRAFSGDSSYSITVQENNLPDRDYSKRSSVNEVIIHHSAGENLSVADIDRIHVEQGYDGFGYHFFITKEGTVIKGRDINEIGCHTYGMNEKTIGICLEGNFEENKPTEAQMNSLLYLSKDLYDVYRIKKFSTHKDYNNTLCPGKNFPKTQFIETLNRLCE